MIDAAPKGKISKTQRQVLEWIRDGDTVYWSFIAGKFYRIKQSDKELELVRAATIRGLRKRGLIETVRGKLKLTEAGEQAV